MKKTYNAPEISVVNIDSSEIICNSVYFGEGTTDDMHAKNINLDFEVDYLDEDL